MAARSKKPSGRKKITPVKIKKLQKLFESLGYRLTTQSGSHMVYRHPDKVHNITVPYKSGHEIQPEIIADLIAKAGISRKEYLDLMNKM